MKVWFLRLTKVIAKEQKNLELCPRNGHKCKENDLIKKGIFVLKRCIFAELAKFCVAANCSVAMSLTHTQPSGETGLSSIFTLSTQTHNMLTQTHRPSRVSPQSTNVITSAYLHILTVSEAFDLLGWQVNFHEIFFFFCQHALRLFFSQPWYRKAAAA